MINYKVKMEAVSYGHYLTAPPKKKKMKEKDCG